MTSSVISLAIWGFLKSERHKDDISSIISELVEWLSVFSMNPTEPLIRASQDFFPLHMGTPSSFFLIIFMSFNVGNISENIAFISMFITSLSDFYAFYNINYTIIHFFNERHFLASPTVLRKKITCRKTNFSNLA